jgi:hypothetical protein
MILVANGFAQVGEEQCDTGQPAVEIDIERP